MMSGDNKDNLQCNICGSKDLESKHDIETELSMGGLWLKMTPDRDAYLRTIGNLAKKRNILYMMDLRKNER